MSDGKQDSSKTTQHPSEPDIIDAEVIREETIPEKEQPTQHKSPSPQKSGNSFMAKLGWLITGVLIAFMGGVYASPYFQEGMVALGLREAPASHIVTPSAYDLKPLNETIANLEAQVLRHGEILAQHENQITETEQDTEKFRDQLSGFTSAGTSNGDIYAAEVASLKGSLERLTHDVARLAVIKREADPAVAQVTGSLALLKAETEQITARFASLENALVAVQSGAVEASPRGRLLLALSRTKERALKGLAFTSDLAALRPDITALSAVDQQLIGAELATLQEASAGITPYEQLVQDFDAVAANALHSAQKEGGSFLANIFTVRRTDSGATGNDAIFLTAERKLSLRDIAGAIDDLKKLQGAALAATEEWRTKATTFIAVEQAFDRTINAITSATPIQNGGVQ